MKKLLLSFVLIVMSFMAMAQFQTAPEWNNISSNQPETFQKKLISSTENSVKVNVQVPGFYTTTVTTPNGPAKVVTMPKAVSTAQAGEPNVPMTGIPVMIGDHARMNVRVIDAKYMDFENVEVAPSKGDFPRSIDPETVPYTYGECYSHDAFFPAQNLGMYEPYIIRDFRGQNMAVYPFAYNPVSKTLRVYYDMTVEMYKVDDKGENVIETRRSNTVKMSPDFKSVYQRHFINFEEGMAKYTPLDEEGDLLIICYDNFMSAMTDFVNWKKTRGINTTIVGTSTAGSTYTVIKNYIQSQYNANNNLTHVLLVGDVAQIPGNSFTASSSSEGDWSGKGDNLYGQIVGNDIYNDVIIGRFSASSVAQVTTQVNRILTYERDLTSSATWCQNGLGISTTEGSGGHNNEDDYQHIENLRTDLLAYGYTTVYQDYKSVSGYPSSTTTTISNHINSGVGIINYCNHGEETGWQSHYYMNSNVNALTNNNKLPFIFSVACLVGKYDYSSGDCFAETWMHATNGSNPTGAIGGFFSYISQPWIPPMWAQDEFVDILCELKNNNIKHTLGGVGINSLFSIFDHYSTSSAAAKGTYQAWVLYGDPSLMLRTKTPQAMTVTHNGSITVGATSYSVSVSNGNGALATITDASHNILGKATVSDGSATINLSGSSLTANQELTLCVFGYNKVTYLGTITVEGGSNVQHSITYNAQQDHGTISVSPANAVAGTVVTLTATPDAGYVLDYWDVNTVSKDNASGTNFISSTKTMNKKAAANGNVRTVNNKFSPKALLNSNIHKGNRGNVEVTNNQFIMPDSEVTISAVFRAESATNVTYDLVTASQDDWCGNYILVGPWNTTTGYAFDGEVDTEYHDGGITAVTIDGTSLSSIGDAALLTITKNSYNSDYYSIRINGGDYLADGQSGMETSSTDETQYTNWTINYTSNGIEIYNPIWSGGPYYLYFVVAQNTSTSQYSAWFTTCTEGAYTNEGYTFEYDFPVLYKETVSGGGQGGSACEDFESYSSQANTAISGGNTYGLPTGWSSSGNTGDYKPHLYNGDYSVDGVGIVMTSGSNTYGGNNSYLISNITLQEGDEVSFNTFTEGSTASTRAMYYGYWKNNAFQSLGTAESVKYNTSGVNATQGLTTFTVPAEANGYPLAWNWNNTSSYWSAVIDNVCVTSYNPTYSVTAASGITNGNLMFTSNGANYVYSPLTEVEQGTSVIINTIPDAGYQLSGMPTLTVTSGTAPTLTQTNADHFTFVMPSSDVTVNATFNCTTPADPTFSVAGGTYTSMQNVSISCATAGATIYYTTDGSTPTNSSTQYTETIAINETTTLKAIAYIGTCTSNVVTATYTMSLPTYTVTCATGLTGGSIAADPTTAVEGTTITITATPESGYYIGTITATDDNDNDVTVTLSGDQGTLTMPAANVNVTATFTQGYNVTLNQTPNGTISADQTTNLQPGDIVTMTATPDNDCVFLAWYAYKTGDPRDVITLVNNSWFFMPSSDVTIQAVFVTEEEKEQTVGGGSNTNENLPTNVWYKYSLTQQIYTAAEINYNGRITAIAFKATAASQNPRTLNIYMAHTSKTAFTSTTDWQTMGPSFLVFEGDVSFSSSDWTTITLDTPFEYDGTSNLNICVVDITGSWESKIPFNTYSTSANRALYVASDDTDYSQGVNASGISDYTGTQSAVNNQIKFTIKVPGSAESLTISPDAISDFSYVESQGPSQSHKLDIVGVDLENNITITAPTNFEVCLTEDGTYTSSLTIPRETSKGNRAQTIWEFDSGLGDWTAEDEDGDGYNWYQTTNFVGYNESAGCVVSASFINDVGALTPNNWLVSPQVELGGTFSLYAVAQDQAWPQEHFGIYVSTDGETYTMLGEWTLTAGDWRQYSVDLRAFAGQNGYIAVRHFNCTDKYYIKVDHFVLDTDAAITVEMPVVMTLQTVFARMKSDLNSGTYSGTLTASAGSGTNVNGSVSLSGEVIAAYNITLAANPTAGGSVAGAGSYAVGTSLTVAARTNGNYEFINWTENGTVVSTDAEYTFTVNADRNLVANFGFTKTISGWDGTDNGNWYLIASPVATLTPSAGNGFITSGEGHDYDLYRFNQSAALEWENYKNSEHTSNFALVSGKGYLYASESSTTLVFTGAPYSGTGEISLDYNDNAHAAVIGWNLVGNPFTQTAYIDREYYIMNSEGTDLIASERSDHSVNIMEGVFVQATPANQSVTFSTSPSKRANSRIILNVIDNDNVVDRAIVNCDEGGTLSKFMIDESNTNIYIPEIDADYAVVRSNGRSDIPVNFKADEMGSYAIVVETEGYYTNYLHLIDRLTGDDVNLLVNNKYTFIASASDAENRFILSFGDNANSMFAYQSGSDIVVTGEGELQIFDVMGRYVGTYEIHGVESIPAMTTGVYIFRMLGDDIKTQKIVVR